MSYALCDINGYVGDLATTIGLEQLVQHAERKKKSNIIAFFEEGSALVTQVLLDEINSLRPKSKDLLSTVSNFQKLAEKCNTVMIIDQG